MMMMMSDDDGDENDALPTKPNAGTPKCGRVAKESSSARRPNLSVSEQAHKVPADADWRACAVQ